MVGGGSRKNEGSITINNTNVFAALDTLRKKKNKDKSKSSSSSKSSSKASKEQEEPQVFWQPAPLTTKSWADVEDEDDDDYYTTTAPLPSVWGAPASQTGNEANAIAEVWACSLWLSYCNILLF